MNSGSWAVSSIILNALQTWLIQSVNKTSLACRSAAISRHSKGWHSNSGPVVATACKARDLVNVLVGGDEDIAGPCGLLDEIMEAGGYSEQALLGAAI